jgi:hypothetical protein
LDHSLTLQLLPGAYAICRLEGKVGLPRWATSSPVFCVMRTDDELSIVCPEPNVPDTVAVVEKGWRVFRLEGPFEFGLTGVLISVLNPLSEAGVGIFALSTYNTDFVLVKSDQIAAARDALIGAGHTLT